MRRLSLILLLTATHGAAVWWGLSGDEGKISPVGTGGAGTAGKADAPLDMAQLLEPEPEKPAQPPVPSWKEQLEAARKTIPAGADVEAMAKVDLPLGSTAAEHARVVAAFGLWMEKDPLAALRWMVSKSGRTPVEEGIRHYLEDKDPAEVNRLLLEVPDAADSVVRAAKAIAYAKGPSDVLGLAAAMSHSGDAFKVLNGGLGVSAELPAQLPVIRKMLDERGCQELLIHFARTGDVSGLSEAAAAAGFSEEAIERMEEEYAKVEEGRAKQKAEESLTLADRIRAGTLEKQALYRSSSRDEYLAKAAPEFADWSADFGDGRLSGAEVMVKFREALGNPQGMEGPLQEYLFGKLYPSNPSAAINWLKEVQPDWQKAVRDATPQLMDSAMSEMSVFPEAVWRATEGLTPEEQEATGMDQRLLSIYAGWHRQDPEDCMAAVKKLPAGPLKDRLLDSLEKKGGRR